MPDGLREEIRPGTIVRVELHGRRVRGWVVGLSDRPETTAPLKPVDRVVGVGPATELLDLSKWAAWRWVGRRGPFLKTASPPKVIPHIQPMTPARPSARLAMTGDSATAELGHAAVERSATIGGPVVVRLPPAADLLAFVSSVLDRAVPDRDGSGGLVLCPSLATTARLATRLGSLGWSVAVVPDSWARAASGAGVALGSRAAAWAPRPHLRSVIVLDEHDEVYQEERTPTWNARDVAIERARRAGAPCVLVSPSPSLEALAAGPLLVPSRHAERSGWPLLEVVDRRHEPPGLGLWSRRVVDLVRVAGRVVCVLNRRGRVRLLACGACGELARCEVCTAPVAETASGAELACARCGQVRPRICSACGGTRLKVLRVGVTRAREELERLAGRRVVEVSGRQSAAASGGADADLLIGTEAVLHRARRADAVAFLDFDQELLAPRYRAGEQAMALLVRAARLVGGRDGGRLVVQTRLPGHEVLDAVLHADPGRWSVVEAARRAALRFPPESALALVSGERANELTAALRATLGVEVLGPASDRWLVRAPDHQTLCDALAAAARPQARTRVEVDPLRV